MITKNGFPNKKSDNAKFEHPPPPITKGRKFNVPKFGHKRSVQFF